MRFLAKKFGSVRFIMLTCTAFFGQVEQNNNTHIIIMKFNFNTEKEYTAPVCIVYSVNLEGAIATMSSGDEVPPTPEEDWGDL